MKIINGMQFESGYKIFGRDLRCLLCHKLPVDISMDYDLTSLAPFTHTGTTTTTTWTCENGHRNFLTIVF